MKNVLFALIAVTATASAAMAGDCRLKLTPSFQVTNFADVDSFKTAYDISKVLSDRKHGFTVSNDADAPYRLDYTIAADASDKRNVKASYSISYQSPNGMINGGGATTENARKEKNQVKLYKKMVNDLVAALPSCSNR